MKKTLMMIILITMMFNIGCNSPKVVLEPSETSSDVEKTEMQKNEKEVIHETEYHKFNETKEANFIVYVGGTSTINNETFLRMTLMVDPTKELRIKKCVLNIKIGNMEKSAVYIPDSQKDELLIPENENEKIFKIPDKTIYENIEYKVTNIEYK